MATAEERMRILKMVEDGKLTAEEGARLLAALRETRKETRPQSTAIRTSGKGWLRVRGKRKKERQNKKKNRRR